MKVKIIAVALLATMSITSFSTARIVYDPTQTARAVAESGKQIQELKSQLDELKKMYSNAVQQLNAVSGFKNFAKEFDPRAQIPEEWKDIYQSASSGNMQGAMNEITKKNEIGNKSSKQVEDDIRKRQLEKQAKDYALGIQSYEIVLGRVERIQEMQTQIQNTKDLKAIGELQASIQSEQSLIQTDLAKIELLKAQSQNEGELIDQQKQQYQEQLFKRNGSWKPSIK